MTAAAWSLQRAIYDALIASPDVTNLIGGTHVYDHVPRGVQFPYIAFGPATVRDWSTGSETGHEHLVTLHVWSQAPGRSELHDIMTAAYGVLHDQPLAISGVRLVNLRQETTEIRRDPDGETLLGIIRLRAVTEPTD